jgi:hypothetical protein
MTEAEWLAATDPLPMLAALRAAGQAGDRKLRLFAAACCRRVWYLMDDRRSQRAVEVAERFADSLASEAEREGAESDAEVVRRVAYDPRSECVERPEEFAAWAAHAAADRSADEAARSAAEYVAGVLFSERWRQAGAAPDCSACEAGERAAQGTLLRDVFGPLPFRGVRLDPAWLAWNSGTVVRLAAAAYEERSLPAGTLDVARLGVLADALEEAGCDDGEILGHLREQGGAHVRGCWAADLLLGKE